MVTQFIRYDGKDYQIKEPTIQNWMDLNKFGDFTDPLDYGVKLISLSTSIPEEEVRQRNWFEVTSISNELLKYFEEFNNEFHKEFEFSGVTYKFIDLPNLSFGEFIDLDTFLTKPEIERKLELHVMMALLYREKDETGKIVKYDGSKLMERAELFRELPIKYYHGSIRFFFHLERVLQRNTKEYLFRLFKVKMMMVKQLIWNRSQSFGRGISRLTKLPKETLQKFQRYWNIRSSRY